MPYTFPKLLARSLATSQKADCNFFLFCFVLFFFFFQAAFRNISLGVVSQRLFHMLSKWIFKFFL